MKYNLESSSALSKRSRSKSLSLDSLLCSRDSEMNIDSSLVRLPRASSSRNATSSAFKSETKAIEMNSRGRAESNFGNGDGALSTLMKTPEEDSGIGACESPGAKRRGVDPIEQSSSKRMKKISSTAASGMTVNIQARKDPILKNFQHTSAPCLPCLNDPIGCCKSCRPNYYICPVCHDYSWYCKKHYPVCVFCCPCKEINIQK